MADTKPDLQKFLTDPAFQADRDLLKGVIDARLKELADKQAEENKNKKDERTFLQRLFDGE